MSVPVTGLVLTLNGEQYLDQCLQSLDFCDEILVIDSLSTDKTQEIAEKHGARFLVNPWDGPAAQFEFAFKQVNTPWVVSLDQDEILSPELKANIMTALNTPSGSGFLCPRTSFYLDRFIRHSGWYPDYLLRVFKLADTRVHVSGPHYGFRSSGTVGKLTGDIVHYPYQDLGEHISKINSYTRTGAEGLRDKGIKPGITKALGHGLARFVKIYILRRGFLDGRAGFVLALNSFFYAFNKYVRLYELTLENRKNPRKK